jgi:hypothetical protein
MLLAGATNNQLLPVLKHLVILAHMLPFKQYSLELIDKKSSGAD